MIRQLGKHSLRYVLLRLTQLFTGCAYLYHRITMLTVDPYFSKTCDEGTPVVMSKLGFFL